ncbi:MAG: hypothetical protein ACT4QA_01175 [Panacagrimonas sp.]
MNMLQAVEPPTTALKHGAVTSIVPEWDLVYVQDDEWAYPVCLSRLLEKLKATRVKLEIDMPVEFSVDGSSRVDELVVDNHHVRLRKRSPTSRQSALEFVAGSG